MARPTSYKSEYCKMLIEHMKSGKSYTTFCATIGKSIETLYNWEEQHQEFLEAKKEAFKLNELFWEDKSIEALTDKIEYDEKGKVIRKTSINPTVLIFNLKNRFPEKWRDVKQLDQKIDQKSVVSVDNADLMLMTDLMKELVKSKNEPSK